MLEHFAIRSARTDYVVLFCTNHPYPGVEVAWYETYFNDFVRLSELTTDIENHWSEHHAG